MRNPSECIDAGESKFAKESRQMCPLCWYGLPRQQVPLDNVPILAQRPQTGPPPDNYVHQFNWIRADETRLLVTYRCVANDKSFTSAGPKEA